MLDEQEAAENQESLQQDPTLNNNEDDSPFVSPSTIIWLVVLAIVAALFLLTSPENPAPAPTHVQPVPSVPSPVTEKEPASVQPVKPNNPSEYLRKKERDYPPAFLQDSTRAVLRLTDLQPPPLNTAVRQQLQMPEPLQKDTVTKKRSGVPGISDTDYRIKAIPKDSVNKN